ncbi:SpaH/EbpB family LPXTG-anchored major pilin [Enterococcus canintestini]|uniref:Uncharacterized protein n=1 Tax=Enterococcus canintestini TaxID=317010 RepID=A0A267HPZ6_9ENTE|nr:SpaH/EbpB family LPXTG-anchored major pilin [Enterococcus canintestini]PAB00396.1 hypothetical protein AKL21_09550 [Enterococcus canintestini]
MKHKSKLFGLLAIITMLVPLFVGGIVGSAASESEPEKIDMILHKKEFDSTPEVIENTGEEMDFPGKNLKGAGFTAFNITDFVYGLIAGGMTSDEAIKKAQEVASKIEHGGNEEIGGTTYDSFTKMGAQVGSEVVTGSNGEAAFNDLAYKTNGKHSVYMFIETTIPDNVSAHAAPLIVSLPLTNKDGEYLETAHLYPKDVTFTDEKNLISDGLPEINVKGNDKSEHIYGTEVGNVHDFTFTFTIPAKIKDKTSYGFTDTPEPGLELVGDVTIAPVAGGPSLVAGTHYTFTKNNDGGFTVDFNVGAADVQALAGKTFKATYQMVVTDAAEEYKEFGNKITVKVGNSIYPHEAPKLVYGGYKFVKEDQNTQAKLAGVEFAVTKRDEDVDKALKFTLVNGKYVLDENGSTKLVTDADGELHIEGLAYGEYDLHETNALSGYIKLDKPVAFTVAPGEEGSSLIPAQTIKNIKEGTLPSTGGTGIIAFLAVGAALMAGAFIWYRKSKVNEEV